MFVVVLETGCITLCSATYVRGWKERMCGKAVRATKSDSNEATNACVAKSVLLDGNNGISMNP